MKKIISALLSISMAASMAVSLSGCKVFDKLKEGETLRWIVLGEKPADFDSVLAEINKIVEPELGMPVSVEFIDAASMSEKMKLKMAEKDTYDVCFTGYCNSYHTAVQMKGLYDITGLLDNIKMKDGSTVKMSDTIDQFYLDSAKVDGKIYGIPNIQVNSHPRCFMILESTAKAANIDVDGWKSAALNATDYDSYKSYLDKTTEELTKLLNVKDKLGLKTIGGPSPRAPMIYETIASGVALKVDGSEELVNVYETPEMKLEYETIRDWFNKGIINRDAASKGETVATVVEQKMSGTWEASWKPGQDTQDIEVYGEPIKYVYMQAPYVKMSNPLATMLSVGANTKHPEEAVKFIYMINSNPELYNLFCWGIEGTHYTKNEDGTVKFVEGSTYGDMSRNAWAYGNQFNGYVLEGQPLDVWEETKKMNDDAIKSPALGFVPDLSGLTTEIASVANVEAEYKAKRMWGTDDPANWYDQFLADLKTAGIDKIKAELQKQYSAFLANK